MSGLRAYGSILTESVCRDENRVRRVNFINRDLFTITDGYDVKGFKKTIIWCWETISKTSNSVESYLHTSAEHLLNHTTIIRGESRREIQLADLIFIKLENEGPKSNEPTPYIIILIR